MNFRGFFLAAALTGAFVLPAAAQDQNQQQAQGNSNQQSSVVIDLQGADSQGQPLTGQAVITPLQNGQVRIDHPVRNQSGQIVNQTGIAQLEGDVLKAQLAPVDQGMAGALTGQQQAAPIELQMSVDAQGRVQSQSPAFQAQGTDQSHKLRDLLQRLRDGTTKALKNLGSRIRDGIEKLKVRLAEARARAAEQAAAQQSAQSTDQAAGGEQQGLPALPALPAPSQQGPAASQQQAGPASGQQQQAE